MQNTRTRILGLIVVSMLTFGYAAAAELRYDHYDPARLNEFAVRMIREGDPGTAMVLLERAALLAPHDARIRQNLETLRTWQQGGQPDEPASSTNIEPAVAEAAQPTPQSTPQSTPQPTPAEDGLPPFPLWPKREAR